MRTKDNKQAEQKSGVLFAVLKLVQDADPYDGCIGHLPVYGSVEEAEAASYFGKFQIVAIQEVKES